MQNQQIALAVKKNNMSSSGDGDHVTICHRVTLNND